MVTANPFFFFAIIRPFGMAMPYVFTHLITDVARRTEPTGFLVARATGSQFRHVAQSGWILRDKLNAVKSQPWETWGLSDKLPRTN